MQFIKEISYDNFDINNFVSEFAKSKIVYIKNVPKDINTDEFYTTLGRKLGLLLKKDVDPINKKIIDNAWTTIKFDERYIEQTYKHSNKHQPLHNDYCNASISIDGVILFCEKKATFGGATSFIDSLEVIELLKTFNPKLLKQLEKTSLIFGKTPSPIFRNTSQVITYDKIGPILNWNYAVVAEDNTDEAKEIANEFHYFLEEYIYNAGIPTDLILNDNEAVFFHDKRILHGRRSFLGDRSLLKGGIFMSNNRDELEKVKNLL